MMIILTSLSNHAAISSNSVSLEFCVGQTQKQIKKETQNKENEIAKLKIVFEKYIGIFLFSTIFANNE